MAAVACPSCGDQTRSAPCCNHRCDGQWGTGCFHCHHPRFWVLELARREETYTTLDLICGVPPGTTSAAADDWHPDAMPSETITYSNRSVDGWPLRSFVVPAHADLTTGRTAAVSFPVGNVDGIHLAAAMRAAGYLVDFESQEHGGLGKITARLRPGHSSTAGT
jgi:hypothetical protein